MSGNPLLFITLQPYWTSVTNIQVFSCHRALAGAFPISRNSLAIFSFFWSSPYISFSQSGLSGSYLISLHLQTPSPTFLMFITFPFIVLILICKCLMYLCDYWFLLRSLLNNISTCQSSTPLSSTLNHQHLAQDLVHKCLLTRQWASQR